MSFWLDRKLFSFKPSLNIYFYSNNPTISTWSTHSWELITHYCYYYYYRVPIHVHIHYVRASGINWLFVLVVSQSISSAWGYKCTQCVTFLKIESIVGTASTSASAYLSTSLSLSLLQYITGCVHNITGQRLTVYFLR